MRIIISELTRSLFGMNIISDLAFAIIIFLSLGPFLISVLFLPALIELKRPKDKGPRSIMDRLPLAKMSILKTIVFTKVVDIDEESFEVLRNLRIAEIIGFLSSFES